MKLVRNYDERAKTIASGMDIRPLTTSEIAKHLESFGIDQVLAAQKIRGFSGGQKSRLVLAAAPLAVVLTPQPRVPQGQQLQLPPCSLASTSSAPSY